MLYFYRIDSKSYGSDITSEGTDTPQRRQSATHPTGANPLINYPTDGQYYAWHNINFGTIWHNITRHNTISTCFHPEEWHEI